jgi:hypothetical protein
MSYQNKLVAELFGSTETKHRNGVAWHEAKRPFPLHKCRAQTTGYIGISEVQRCACGGIRNGKHHGWLRKNERWSNTNPLFAGVIAGVLALVSVIAVFLIF